VGPEQGAFVMGGYVEVSAERYDTSSGKWSTAAAMGIARVYFGVFAIAGEVYVTGGSDDPDGSALSSVEKYSASTDTWSTVAPLPVVRERHAAVAVGSDMYVLGGLVGLMCQQVRSSSTARWALGARSHPCHNRNETLLPAQCGAKSLSSEESLTSISLPCVREPPPRLKGVPPLLAGAHTDMPAHTQTCRRNTTPEIF
jgi:hypothetical protein